ncbi:MAG: Rieske 2Fe-2S domain-containing protein [Pseudomonadota bacterium]|nr:Rieske 2Fe-2S domain-containing protein [Pseudomonadota bacterium]
MGNLFRRYWIPFLLSDEIAEKDCPPVRVTLLSERLVAFRDSNGEIGLIEEFCAHRRVSLWFGRNEEGGLRCPYHGWKFDFTGKCLEIPSEPDDSTFRHEVSLTSYPCIERGGIVWTYMGPPEYRPEPPAFEWVMVSEKQRYHTKRLQESNYLQALEGGIDSSHVGFLHTGELRSDPLHHGSKGSDYHLSDRKPRFEVKETTGGLNMGVRRNAAEDNYYWRITPWIMPWYTIVPPYGDNPLHGHAWVPIDDATCFAWTFSYHPSRPLNELEMSVMTEGGSLHVTQIPGTFRPVANRYNDYHMDREAQKAGTSSSGVKGIAMQDASIQESMGTVADRSRENLVLTDRGITQARRLLLKSAENLERGIQPPGLSSDAQAVRSASFELDRAIPFDQAPGDPTKVKKGVAHTSI